MGRETYTRNLSAIAAADRLRSEDPELEPDQKSYYSTQAAHTQSVADWVSELLTSIPAASRADTVPVCDLVASFAAFCRQAAVRSPEDAAAWEAIVAALDFLQPLSDTAS